MNLEDYKLTASHDTDAELQWGDKVINGGFWHVAATAALGSTPFAPTVFALAFPLVVILDRMFDGIQTNQGQTSSDDYQLR